MFNNYEQIKRRIDSIQEELKHIEKLKKEFPKENLICAKNNQYYKWYLRTEIGTTYLPKQNKDMAQKLALKKYYQLRENELKVELEACRAYMKKIKFYKENADDLLGHEEYSKLLGQSVYSVKQELQEWMAEEYDRCRIHPENLIVKATLGKYVRSKSEAIIDKLLFNAGIPFRYEDKLVLGDNTIYPDFTVRHPRTAEYYYWEHFGLLDDPKYVSESVCRKIKLYSDNGIIPSVKMIFTFETKSHPLSIETVERIIREYFL